MQADWENPAADTKYTQQLALDVGDIPGHQVRVREVHSVYWHDKPNCEGLKRTEVWDRGFSDYIDRNGRPWGYAVITFGNGDKIYTEWSGTSQTTVGQDGSKEGHYEGVTRWTGGTGRYATVRGFKRNHVKFNLDKGSVEAKEEKPRMSEHVAAVPSAAVEADRRALAAIAERRAGLLRSYLIRLEYWFEK